jgi:hypothetical protein
VKPALTITDTDWKRIEGAYGHELTPKAREQVYGATWKFLAFVESEQAADPVSAVPTKIKSIAAAASKLNDAISPVRRSDATAYAHHLINRNFHDPRIGGKLKALACAVDTLVEACKAALMELKNSSYRGRRKNAAYQQWLFDLGSIARAHRLPTEARKDTDKNKTDRSSPFVEFIFALQLCLPKQHCRSAAALAQAIHSTRKIASGRVRTREPVKKSRKSVRH